MKAWVWTSVFCVALLIGGCPKRQSGPRLVYVPAPPPAASAAPAPDSGTLVIEEPAPAESDAAKPTGETPPPVPPPRPRQQKTQRGGTSAEPAATEPAADEPSSVEPPALERANGAGQAGRRQDAEKLQRGVRLRLEQFRRQPLSNAEVQTLAEAEAFLVQSERALNQGDVQRSYNLAHKADLLLTAFEKGY